MPPAAVASQPRPTLQTHALTKLYRSGDVEVQALRGGDLTLGEGELVVLLGPSGSGRSTLLNILGGLGVPSGGTVVLRDTPITAADEAALTRWRRDHVGFVFHFDNLIPSPTARERRPDRDLPPPDGPCRRAGAGADMRLDALNRLLRQRPSLQHVNLFGRRGAQGRAISDAWEPIACLRRPA